MYHGGELGLPLEISIDITPKIHSPSEAIYECIEFLESHRVDTECIQTFRLLISEAIANALEHGVLRLPSSRKEDMNYALKKEIADCRTAFTPGQVKLKIQLLCHSDSGLIETISVEVSDSGQGFDWQKYLANIAMPAPEKIYGRGLALIKMTASHLSFNEAGNTIKFAFPCKLKA
ncbi:MAG: ATP-binding protein [Holophagaceae bacterium]|nr:ATP-binding protein [Holophagaceae bacterium]